MISTQLWRCLATAVSGKQENWFIDEGKEAVTKYQGQVFERFKQIKMLQVLHQHGRRNVFVESRGDYISQDGTANNNVYIFAKLAGLLASSS